MPLTMRPGLSLGIDKDHPDYRFSLASGRSAASTGPAVAPTVFAGSGR
jgi:hypothetical protein